MLVDGVGWAAAALTLLTFSMREMRALRITGMTANLAFIFYGFGESLYPVVVLHTLLLPCNALRLCQIAREKRAACTAAHSPPIPHCVDEATAGQI